MKIRIPGVVSSDGRVEAWLTRTPEGENRTDVGLLYDAFNDYTDNDIREICIEVDLDLEAIFKDVIVRGDVTKTIHPADAADN